MDDDEELRTAAIRAWRGRFWEWARVQGQGSHLPRGRIPAQIKQGYIDATGDDLDAILSAMPTEPVLTPYDWLDDNEWMGLREAFTLTWVRGTSPHEALVRLGAFDITAESMLAKDAMSQGIGRTGSAVGATRLGAWTVICEQNGFEGLGSVRGLSRGGEAVAVYKNVNHHMRFIHGVDGEVIVEFDPMFPADRWGADPQRLLGPMDALGLHTSGTRTVRRAELRALSLADHVTGAHVTPELLRGPFVWGEARNIPSTTPPPPEVTLRARDPELADAIVAADDARRARAGARHLRHLARDAGVEGERAVADALAALDDHDRVRLHALVPGLELLFATWKEQAAALPQLHMIDRRRDLDMLQRIQAATVRGIFRHALQGALLSDSVQATCTALEEVSHMTVVNQSRRHELLTLLRSGNGNGNG